MKKIIALFLLFIAQFSNAENPPIMSECYSYHTPHYYELFTENNRIIFEHTVKDPNGISYVSMDKIVLDSINSKGFKILAEDAEKILFTTVDGHFIMEKKAYETLNYGISKISDNNSTTETIGTDLICKNDIWYHIIPKGYSKEIIEKEVNNVPDNLEIYQTGIVRDGILMKNEEAVYIFNERELTFKKIPNLTGKNTRFVKIDQRLKKGFIYDNDTFYLIAFDELIDYTGQFTSNKEFTNFKNAEIIQHEFEVSINTNDGTIWLYLRFDIENEKGERTKIVPVKANYLGKNKELIFYKEKAYNDFYDLLNNRNPINISAIKDPLNLTKDAYFYTDGKMRYLFDYENHAFKPVKWLPVNIDYYLGHNTYGFLGNSPFYADNSTIYFIDKLEKKSKTLKHTSAIKDLKLAYAYDDKLLIENKEIKNSADRESMEFVGSTVDVINGCDGGKGQYAVRIDVYYFFKDNNGVYVYNTTNPKIRQLENQNPFKVQIDNYDYLVELMKAS